ncbi:peroxisomal membrane protein [Seminavis robusta]|uniref:Peroxisomal membrane protein n=1 Tax=Seminavis robusta TaxID=568900 RepID=A0A9N8ECK5_9STRA|nr:peroxisomal membrane protein [Seminavis robusta]|eukprot:Sro748_g196710.1 peroxisomal membrane protein (331) ;mRNA; r:25128-26120
MMSLQSFFLLSLLASPVASFGGFDPALIHHSVSTATSAAESLIHHHSHVVASSSAAASSPLDAAQSLLNGYKNQLAAHPLQTKMMTGATLAMCGDAIAQSKEEGPYDTTRAASFGTFDMAYRALQHASFPWIVEHCKGQFLTAALAGILASTHISITPDITQNFAAMEQTLASQLGIVPFLYYPVFFGLTGFMQGLTVSGSVERAQEKFLPLMQRNLLFWIPVQFVQFGFVEESLQIPFLSVCGLGWTFILSIMAGSTKNYQDQPEDKVNVVVLPMEDEQVIFQPSHLDALGAAVVAATGQPEELGMIEEELAIPSQRNQTSGAFAYEQP